METTKFCTGCGNGLIESAAMCPKCGTPVAGLKLSSSATQKKRNTAILLAVFLGFWTYIYTFAKDKAKFFIFLAANTVAYIISMTTLAMASEQTVRQASCLYSSFDYDYGFDSSMCDMYQPNYAGVIIGLVIQLGIYVFILVDRIRKTEEYYSNYPN